MRMKSPEELRAEETKEYWKDIALNAIADRLGHHMNFSKSGLVSWQFQCNIVEGFLIHLYLL